MSTRLLIQTLLPGLRRRARRHAKVSSKQVSVFSVIVVRRLKPVYIAATQLNRTNCISSQLYETN